MKDIITYTLTMSRSDVVVISIAVVAIIAIIFVTVKVWTSSGERLRRYAKRGKFTITKP